MNITIKSYGTQTISDNSLFVIDNDTIVFPLEGELILFSIGLKNVIRRRRLSPSLIKSIIRFNETELVVATEGAEVFIIDSASLQVKAQWHLRMVNNVYRIKLSPDKRYLALSTHVISEETTREIISQEDAVLLVSIDKEAKVVLCEQSKNNFCCLYNVGTDGNDLRLVSFGKEEDGTTKAVIYSITSDTNAEVMRSIILPIASDINIVKELKDLAILGCFKRYFYVYSFAKEEIVLGIHIEGKGEVGNYTVVNSLIYLPPSSGRLYQVDYKQLMLLNSNNKKEVEIYQDISKNNDCVVKEVLKGKSAIKGLNWSLNIVNGMAIVSNEGGLYGISLNGEEEFTYHCESQLSISGCGLSINPQSNHIAMGDLGGYITHYDSKTDQMKKIGLEGEMIRAVEYNEYSNEVIVGVMSGKIYRYNSEKNEVRLLSNNLNEETVTCIRVYLIHSQILLLFSTIKGEISIYSYSSLKDDYEPQAKFAAHLPQEDNTNMLFGSLSIKAEIWSFLAFPQSALNDSSQFILASASEDQTIKIWSIPYSFDTKAISNNRTIKDNSLAVTCLDWKKMNVKGYTEILISCSDDRTVNGYDPLNSFNHFFKLDIGKMLYGFFTLTYIVLEENSARFAVGAQIGYLLIYSLETMSYVFVEKTHYGGLEGLAWKGSTIATCGNDTVFNIYTLT